MITNMKITFDSNVWRKVASPEKFPKEPSITDFIQIKTAINNKLIVPFLSETVFTLEAIKRKDRKDFFSDYKPKISITEGEENGSIKLSILIGPDKKAHPGNSGFLEGHLKDASELGFKILKFPRIAGVINQDIEKYFYKQNDIDLKTYLEKVHKVGHKIEESGAGIAFIKRIGEKYNTQWMTGIELAPQSEEGNIASAIAEWADGDSVAAHIAIGGDYFCTRDIAKKAGDKSIFSTENLKWLKYDYGFEIVTPEELANKLSKK
jgi:hypothetical protein